MYSYYMLAAMGPKVQKYLWWKKYLTLIQMVQFVLVMLHAFQLLFKNDCDYPIYFAYFIGAHAVLFYFLFSNFYKEAYKSKVSKVYYFIWNTLINRNLWNQQEKIARDNKREQEQLQNNNNTPDNNNDKQYVYKTRAEAAAAAARQRVVAKTE